MNLEILQITDPGIAHKERLDLKVITEDNIGGYIVLDTMQLSPGKVSSIIKNAFWFPDENVKTGDIILLYTGPGKDIQTKNLDGSTTWYYYWGKKSTIWDDQKSAAAVLRIGSWKYKGRS